MPRLDIIFLVLKKEKKTADILYLAWLFTKTAASFSSLDCKDRQYIEIMGIIFELSSRFYLQ